MYILSGFYETFVFLLNSLYDPTQTYLSTKISHAINQRLYQDLCTMSKVLQASVLMESMLPLDLPVFC